MRVTHLGHAGLKIETPRGTILTDPWFSPEGAFQGSWFQFPDNSHLLSAELYQPTSIVISHEHMDHVDPWFLARVSPSVPVIVHQYPSDALVRKIRASGPRPIISVTAWEEVSATEDAYVFFVPEESPVNHDAAIVIHSNGRTVLNMNDARLSPIQLREIRERVGGEVELFCLQGSGASWYPICYDYPDERRKELSRKKRLVKLSYVRRAITVLAPQTVLPFAGPPCFLDPDLSYHNDEMKDGIFPEQQHVADWLARRGIENTIVLLPGDSWDIDERHHDRDPQWEVDDLEDRAAYLMAYADRRKAHLEEVLKRYPSPGRSLWPDFQHYFREILQLSDYFNQRINMRVGFDIGGPGGGRWSVDFRPGLEGVYDEIRDCSYRFHFDSRWLPSLLDGRIPWEDFLLSLRFRVSRDPDLYNDHLLGLLKFAEKEPLAAVEGYEKKLERDERIILRAEGREYRVQRRCPHAGHDLSETGEILPGKILRCLAHHYEFSLETGECLNGLCGPLATEPAE